MARPSTFSIVAFDPEQEAWGIAVASKFPAVGAVVPWASSGAGAVATQSFANTSFGPQGLDLMRQGYSAERAMRSLLDADEGREHRQLGMVDAHGQPATFTGKECLAWAGGRTGPHFAVQGNILAGPEVVEAMASAFEQAEGDFPARLLAALSSGDQAGGDRRGKQSAALFIVKAGAGYGGFNDIWIDYRVDDAPEPIAKLVELSDLHRLYFGKSDEKDKLPIEGSVARRLIGILRKYHGFKGPEADQLDEVAKGALLGFIGKENFEDRTDFERLLIDRPVYEFLVQRFGGSGQR